MLRQLRDINEWPLGARMFERLVSDRTKDNESETFNHLDSRERYLVLDEAFIANFYLGKLEECRRILAMFARVQVDQHILENSNHLFDLLRQAGYHIVGTCDPRREPQEKEIVISFGNYLLSRDHLPWRDKLYRHAFWWRHVRLDVFESDPCWGGVSQIYVINLEKRRDRLAEMMSELARMGAPLERVRRFPALEGDPQIGARIRGAHACSRSHKAVLEDFLAHPDYKHVLVLEDDVTFSTRVDKHQQDLAEFFRRGYDYDVCLINSRPDSDIRPFDDLLNLSFQACTTASGYLLSRQGAEKVLPVWVAGLELLTRTGETWKYALDCYWSAIQKDRKFFVFVERFGYQRLGFSDLGGGLKAPCDSFF